MAKQPAKRGRGRPKAAGGVTAKFFVRLPEELKAPLEAAAKRAERSVTAEVVFRVRESLARDAGK